MKVAVGIKKCPKRRRSLVDLRRQNLKFGEIFYGWSQGVLATVQLFSCPGQQDWTKSDFKKYKDAKISCQISLYNIMYFLQKDDIMLHFTLSGFSDITGCQCLLF